MINVNRWADRQLATSSSHVLVDTDLSASDAGDLTAALLDTVLRFHRLQNLRSQVNLQESDSAVLEFIQSLGSTQADLEEQLSEARELGKRVRIRSRIELEIDDDVISR